ncbi:MAG: phosphatase PAP2 family protein [Candidatus Veblenbacteria bacterium]|nr:phosphatase PAP2 family protein [Candidatus Veblenbacteria bacterium]MDZ4230162.1 phosphatase PAP2 family protein [Candidatus Veblenbacteria bacterium]
MWLDVYLYQQIVGLASETAFGRDLSVAAASVFIWALIVWCFVALAWHKRGNLKDFFALVLGGSMVYLFNILVTFWWWRPRPFLLHDIEPLIYVGSATKSFPSDHAALAFFLAYLLAAHRGLWRWAYVVAALVAIGRVAVGVHYPLDVVGGALVGIAFGYLACEVEKLFQSRAVR